MFLFPIAASLLAIVFSLFLARKIKATPSGSGKIIDISQTIQEEAKAYLKKQYQTIGLVSFFIFVILCLAINFKAALGFLLGVIFSALIGYLGMMVSSQANPKVVEAAKKGLDPSLKLAFRSGAAIGFLVVGMGLLAVSGFYFLFKDLDALVALGFGGSLTSVFSRLGNGIFSKTAAINANLVGKAKKDIPDDDSRNLITIAALVGNNVNDCVGSVADLFETYVVTLVAAMLLGHLLFINQVAVFLPLILASMGIFASIPVTFLVKIGGKMNIIAAFYKALLGAVLFVTIGFFPALKELAGSLDISFVNLYLLSFLGLMIVVAIFFAAERAPTKKYNSLGSIASASETENKENVIHGLMRRTRSTILLVILICIGILISFSLAGLYGLTVTSLVMFSLIEMIVSFAVFGSIADNTLAIAEAVGLPAEVCETTAALDTVGNIMKTVTKIYSIVAAVLASLILFYAYIQEIRDRGLMIQFLLDDYKVLTGLFLGGLVPSVFARMVTGTKKMIIPALTPILIPILTAIILGPKGLAGLLIGSIISGLVELGDFRKGAAGLTISPPIKTLNVVALLIVSFLV